MPVLRWALGLTLAVLPFGCFGGQTGQPTAGSGSGGTCSDPTVDVPVDQPVRGVVPLDAALALEGSLVEPLLWFDALGGPIPGSHEDELTLTFTYDGGPAAYDPCASTGPKIQMLLEVRTRDTGIVDGGPAWVSFVPPGAGPEPFGPSGVFGSFVATSDTLQISGAIIQDASGKRTRGRLQSTLWPVPSGYGQFGPPSVP
jgi:hypothetical protein